MSDKQLFVFFNAAFFEPFSEKKGILYFRYEITVDMCLDGRKFQCSKQENEKKNHFSSTSCF